jgi:phosphopantetheinyl transferase
MRSAEIRFWQIDSGTFAAVSDKNRLRKYFESSDTLFSQKEFEVKQHITDGFIYARLLLKLMLAKYFFTDCSDISSIEILGRFGKSKVQYKDKERVFNLSVSHCGSLIAAAVSEKNSIGIDVQEKLKPELSDSVTERYYCKKSCGLSGERLWTLVESFSKCENLNLFFDITDLRIDLTDNVIYIRDKYGTDFSRRVWKSYSCGNDGWSMSVFVRPVI